MYGSILGGHLEATDFEAPIKRLGTTLITAALDLHAAVANAFLPSAVKFHYQFNLRELSTITEVMTSGPDCQDAAGLNEDLLLCSAFTHKKRELAREALQLLVQTLGVHHA